MKHFRLLKQSLFILLLVNLVGCHFSFHSNQFQMAKAVLSLDDKVAGSEPDWELDWNGYNFLVLAVTVKDQVWFVGPDDLVVVFDGWQIIQASNLLPASAISRISILEDEMNINLNNRATKKFDCIAWIKVVNPGGSVTHKQQCQSEDLTFQNLIYVNRNGQITELVFLIHPEYPRVKLTNLSL